MDLVASCGFEFCDHFLFNICLFSPDFASCKGQEALCCLSFARNTFSLHGGTVITSHALELRACCQRGSGGSWPRVVLELCCLFFFFLGASGIGLTSKKGIKPIGQRSEVARRMSFGICLGHMNYSHAVSLSQ